MKDLIIANGYVLPFTPDCDPSAFSSGARLGVVLTLEAAGAKIMASYVGEGDGHTTVSQLMQRLDRQPQTDEVIAPTVTEVGDHRCSPAQGIAIWRFPEGR